MKVTVKCFANLAEAEACDYRQATPYDLQEGATVRDLAQMLSIDPQQIKLIFVNGKGEKLDTVLKEGDQVGLAPPSGGM